MHAEQVRQLSNKSDLHAELATLGGRLHAAALAEASLRHRLREAEEAQQAAEERERATRLATAATGSAFDGAGACGGGDGGAAPTGGGPAAATGGGRGGAAAAERVLLRQRDEIEALRRQLGGMQQERHLHALRSEEAAEARGGAAARASQLQAQLGAASASLETLRHERDKLRDELGALKARREPRPQSPPRPVPS